MRLDDPQWKTLEGGYRVPYDASRDLRALASGEDGAMSRLWEQLHHQGDVGLASYAAVPALIEIYAIRPRNWNFYGLVNLIEVCRHQGAMWPDGSSSHYRPNPPLPDWLAFEYQAALRNFLKLALYDVSNVEERETLQQILAAIAIGKGDIQLGEFLALRDKSEIEAFLAGKFEWTS
jgi:hypothetical protein